jgi:hypothetical protein
LGDCVAGNNNLCIQHQIAFSTSDDQIVDNMQSHSMLSANQHRCRRQSLPAVPAHRIVRSSPNRLTPQMACVPEHIMVGHWDEPQSLSPDSPSSGDTISPQYRISKSPERNLSPIGRHRMFTFTNDTRIARVQQALK